EEVAARRLYGLMKETGTTLYMVLSAVFNILLSRYGGSEDIIVGTPAAGRYHADLGNTVGFFLETLALRNRPGGDKTFTGFLEEIKHTTLKGYQNQDYPFRELVKRLWDKNDLARNPLFDVMLNVLNQEQAQLEMEGVTVTPIEFDSKVAKVDITLEAVEIGETGGRISLELEYCSALFKRETMERFSNHFVNVLGEVTQNPGVRLSEIEILSEAEQKQLLETFNDTVMEYDGNKLVHRLFEEQVERSSSSAVVTGKAYHPVGTRFIASEIGTMSLTYGELNKKSNQLAHLLRERGVQPGTIVGIMAERSPALFIGLMAILKSGGAYLPLDHQYPKERIDYMTADSGTQLLLTTRDLWESKTYNYNKALIYLEDPCEFANDNPEPAAGPTDFAYIIYTSGSTGRPKGVIVKHENLSAYLFSFEQEFEIKAGDVVIQQASYSFDAFVEEVFPCLSRGGCLALPSADDVKDTARLAQFILDNKVNIIDCSPLLLNELNQWVFSAAGDAVNPLRSIHTFISGGDVLKREYVDNLLKTGTVYNTYGPTETTICATYHKLTGDEPSSVPIGKPITNYRVDILDPYGRLQPVGVPGELCIGGVGVARGYLNRPELTAERFNRSYYKTGDLARWLPDGSIEFLGRIDRQVNLRGFRVELGEIESQLLAHEDITEAAVTVIGNHAVCAYFSAWSAKTVGELREFLAVSLPDYMIPAYFVQLESMPVTASGKIDTRALPHPSETGINTGVEYEPPDTGIEKRLVEIWREILELGSARVGIRDSFFDLGGDSILVNRCIALIREEFRTEVPLRQFFERPFIKALAEEIGRQDRQVISLEPQKRVGEIPLSFAQERLWFLQELDAENTAYFVPRIIRMKGDLDVSLIERAFTGIIGRHEILRTVFPAVDGRPVQRIQDPYPFEIPVIDWSREEKEEQEEKVSQFLREEGQRLFDFIKGPLLRVTVLKLNEKEHLLVLTEHHLVHDGWTQGVLLREFIALFTAFSENRPHRLPGLPIQYADYAIWQRNYLQGEVLTRHLDYWEQKLSGLAPVLDLPVDRPRPPVISGEGALEINRLPGEFTRRVKEFSRKNGATLFMTMSAVFKTLLYRYTGVEDLCVGTGIANRRYREIESMLGMVINTLPLRTAITGDISFRECLNRVKETCLEGYQHEDTPFGKIVERIQPERNLSYMPIFQVMFSFMDTPGEDLRLPGLELEILDSHNRSAKFDINVVVVPPPEHGEEGGGEMLVEWEYNTDIFDPYTINRMTTHYNRLLEEITQTPGKNLSALSMLTDSETRQLLYTFNRTAGGYPRNKTVHQLFEEQTQRTPDGIAIAAPSPHMPHVSHMTYAELNEKSGRLAGLLQTKGVKPGIITGILMARSIEMTLGILGVLKAGAAYLPIAPDTPALRKKYMLTECRVEVLVTTRQLFEESKKLDGWEGEKIFIEDDSVHHTDSASALMPAGTPGLAYVIFTSGSTGVPKGVPITHSNLSPLLHWGYGTLNFCSSDRLLQIPSYYFDWSVWDIFLPLTSGACIYMISDEMLLNSEALLNFIKKNDITAIEITPSQFQSLLSLELKPGALA
ncbi:MAG: amino acid adenylation domain-containing protein, partial [bacterium]|nr:amino acid adenylation domain-containing protein [bacterium]